MIQLSWKEAARQFSQQMFSDQDAVQGMGQVFHELSPPPIFSPGPSASSLAPHG